MTRRFAFQLLAAFVLGLLIVALCPRAGADCSRVRVCPSVVVTLAVVTPVVPVVTPAVVQAYPVAVPLYSAGYDPSAATVAALTEAVRAQNAALAAHEARLARLEGGRPPARAAAPTMPPAAPEAVQAPGAAPRLFTSCAKCHTAGALNPKTTFVMFSPDGREAPLDCQHVARVLVKVGRGEMPPSGPPTAEADLAELEDHYAGK